MLVDWAPSEVEAPRRLCLSADEASFVQAAFERILPEAPHVSASTYVDRKLAESMCVDATAGELELYREAIACVQERCRFEHGRPFQALTPWHQLAILAHLEGPQSSVPASASQVRARARQRSGRGLLRCVGRKMPPTPRQRCLSEPCHEPFFCWPCSRADGSRRAAFRQRPAHPNPAATATASERNASPVELRGLSFTTSSSAMTQHVSIGFASRGPSMAARTARLRRNVAADLASRQVCTDLVRAYAPYGGVADA
jgi:hypothetical protein